MKCRGLSLLTVSVGLFLSSLFSTHSLQASIAIRSSQSGAEVHWPQGAHLTFRTNSTNSSQMSAQDIFTVFTTSLNRWKSAARNGFSFTYYQGTDSSRYPNQLGSPYDNSIFFTSNAQPADQLPCGVIALTETWFDPSNGQASKADLRFNDKCYTFTNNPTDTVSQSRIFLGDVATHELGHALGLDHSQVLQSTMIYTAALEMSYPSCDDQAALINLYAGSTVKGRTGNLKGRVMTQNGAPVFGAHVVAIDLERSVALASTLSDRDGSFSVRSLEPGHYTLLIEPYYPGSSSLSSYYSGMNSRVCNGQNFERTFVSGSGSSSGTLTSFSVSAGHDTDAGSVATKCQVPTSLNSDSESALNTAPVLTSLPVDSPVSTLGVLSSSQDGYFRLDNQSGHIAVGAMGYSLFSRPDLQVELLDSTGRKINGQNSSNVFSSSSGYVNYDAQASADLGSVTDLIVHVYSRSNIATSSYPSGSLGISTTPYYVLTASRGGALADTSLYANNARCESADAFAPYHSPGEAPPFSNPNSNPSSGSAGCGTIRDEDPTSPGGFARLANFAALALMLVVARRLLLSRAGLKFKRR